MPDKSSYRGLRRGRLPDRRLLTVPYRVEEWGKSARVRPPEWWPEAQRVMARGEPYFLKDGQSPEGFAMRGRPGMGSLATFIGASASAPREPWMPTTYRIVLEGFARSEAEARARVAAFVKARLAERVGKARRRAKAASAAGARTSGSASASPAN